MHNGHGMARYDPRESSFFLEWCAPIFGGHCESEVESSAKRIAKLVGGGQMLLCRPKCSGFVKCIVEDNKTMRIHHPNASAVRIGCQFPCNKGWANLSCWYDSSSRRCECTNFALLHVAAKLLLVLLNGAGLAAACRKCLGQTQRPDQLHQVSVTSGTRHPWHKAGDNRNSAKPQ
eukprot:1153913-Pelagomonas_calceolata.AAC.1